jgi:hypothetical protein
VRISCSIVAATICAFERPTSAVFTARLTMV